MNNNHRLEAKAIIEASGNYADEEIDDLMEVYDLLIKHVGFVDNRSDKRFVVKFHDIFYCMPDMMEKEEEEAMDNVFDNFCEYEYETLMDDLNEHKIGKHYLYDFMLSKHEVGHYSAFAIDIPEITKDNAVELAMEIYDECDYDGIDYVKDYIYIVEALQNMEDYYMEDWIEFLDDTIVPQKIIDGIKENYKKLKERRQATQTLAKLI